MAKEVEINIGEKVSQGWVHTRFTIEVQGNNAEHLEKSLDKLAEALGKRKFVEIIDKKLDKTETVEEGWFSNFIEIEALVKGFDGMVEVATQFSPSTLEVLAPKKVSIPASELQTALIDISSLVATFAHAAYLARKQLKKDA